MFSIFTIVKDIFSQRLVIYIIACFFALVLFNTTYMSLGTYVPLILMLFGIFIFLISSLITRINSQNIYYIWLAITIFLSSLLSIDGDLRVCFKILLTVIFVYCASCIYTKRNEVKFLSLFIPISYLVYAILVIQAIGGETAYFGRAQITILGGDIPLDPNVVSSVFVLPLIISLYNLLYGRYKFIALAIIIVNLIAIMALGSRGATISVLLSSSVLLLGFITTKKTKIYIKLLSVLGVIIAVCYAIYFISSQENIFGIDRIFDFSGKDASNGRSAIWSERLGLILDSPIWGYGVSHNVGLLAHSASHNTLIEIFFYSGFLGGFLFLWPTIILFKRPVMRMSVKLALFISVFLPTFFIDTLQERTIWNFILFYSLLSTHKDAENCLIWNKQSKYSNDN